MTDQQRLDYTGYSGSGKLDTPNMDRIGASCAFNSCQTVNPICTPARTALLTGRYTHQIGTLDMSGDLSRFYKTYPAALQEAGYHTSGIGKFHFLQTWQWRTPRGKGVNLYELENEMKEYGFDYIWETSGKQLAVNNYCHYCKYLEERGLLEKYRDWCDSAGNNASSIENWDIDNTNGLPSPLPDEDYIDTVTTDVTVDRIKKRPENQPFFIFCSFCSPHKPFDPPAAYLERMPYEEIDDFIPGEKAIPEEKKKKLYQMRRSYKAMIKLLDDSIGRIFSTLEDEGILDDTVVIFTTDHGEMLGDHLLKQKRTYYKESSTVPTMIRHPEFLSNRVINTPIEITDLTATILDIAGLDPEAALGKEWPRFNDRIPCKSLMSIVKGETDRIRDFSFTECGGSWVMLQDDNYKYVRLLEYDAPGDYREILYDIVNDPDETTDISNLPENAQIIRKFRDRRDFVIDKTPPAQTSWAPLIS